MILEWSSQETLLIETKWKLKSVLKNSKSAEETLKS